MKKGILANFVNAVKDILSKKKVFMLINIMLLGNKNYGYRYISSHNTNIYGLNEIFNMIGIDS